MSKLKIIASGVGWGSVSTVVVTILQLILMAVMARLLDPANFGLLAIANVSLRFFSYFAQLGTGPALIQKPSLEAEDISAALTVSLFISSVFSLFAILAAPLFESFYSMPGLANVIRVLSLNFLIGGFSVVSDGLLRRQVAFRAIAIIEIVSYVLGYGVVGLFAAMKGFGVWALVAAFMVQSTSTACFSYAVVRYPFSFRHTSEQRKHFLSYGGRYSVIGFIEFLTSNLDAMIIGKLFGVTIAGFYNRALLLSNLPVQHPSNILTRALFPVMSSVGDQQNKQSIGLQLGILLVGGYAFAVSVGVYVASKDVVLALLGSKWLAVIPILQVLAWAVGPQFVSHVIGVSMDAMGELSMKLKIQLGMLSFLLIIMAIAAKGGDVINIARVVVIVEWVRFIFMMYFISKLLRINNLDIARMAICIFVLTLSSCMAIYGIRSFLDNFSTLVNVFRLLAEVFAGAVGLVVGVLCSYRIALKIHAVRFLVSRASG